MTKEEKRLLFTDLCGRLPYGVKVKYKSREKEGNVKITYGNIGYIAELGNGWWKECKPYLRPMSSMTDEERKELKKLCEDDLKDFIKFIKEGHGLSHDGLYMFYKLRQFDWLNAHHFDYRGLIEKGLALEAPEGMYGKEAEK